MAPLRRGRRRPTRHRAGETPGDPASRSAGPQSRWIIRFARRTRAGVAGCRMPPGRAGSPPWPGHSPRRSERLHQAADGDLVDFEARPSCPASDPDSARRGRVETRKASKRFRPRGPRPGPVAVPAPRSLGSGRSGAGAGWHTTLAVHDPGSCESWSRPSDAPLSSIRFGKRPGSAPPIPLTDLNARTPAIGRRGIMSNTAASAPS